MVFVQRCAPWPVGVCGASSSADVAPPSIPFGADWQLGVQKLVEILTVLYESGGPDFRNVVYK